MKKLTLSTILFFVLVAAKSQNKVDSIPLKFSGNNEIKVNGLYAILGAVNFTYERILSKEIAIGVSALIVLDKSLDYRSEYNPYLRAYLGGKKADGFFLEGDIIFINREDYSKGLIKTEILPDGGRKSSSISTGTRNSYGIAGGLGYKVIIKKGFLIEVNGAIGRLLGDLDGKRPKSTGFLSGIDEIYVKAGITIGKRF